jgi:hypothetical protein
LSPMGHTKDLLASQFPPILTIACRPLDKPGGTRVPVQVRAPRLKQVRVA